MTHIRVSEQCRRRQVTNNKDYGKVSLLSSSLALAPQKIKCMLLNDESHLSDDDDDYAMKISVKQISSECDIGLVLITHKIFLFAFSIDIDDRERHKKRRRKGGFQDK